MQINRLLNEQERRIRHRVYWSAFTIAACAVLLSGQQLITWMQIDLVKWQNLSIWLKIFSVFMIFCVVGLLGMLAEQIYLVKLGVSKKSADLIMPLVEGIVFGSGILLAGLSKSQVTTALAGIVSELVGEFLAYLMMIIPVMLVVWTIKKFLLQRGYTSEE